VIHFSKAGRRTSRRSLVLSDAVSGSAAVCFGGRCARRLAASSLAKAVGRSRSVPQRISTYEYLDIVGALEVQREGNGRRQSFEVLGEDLAAAAPPLGTLQGCKPRLQDVVRAINQADAAALVRDRKDAPSEMGAMTVRMRQNQVDGRAQILGGAAFGSGLFERSGELPDGGSDVVQLRGLPHGSRPFDNRGRT